jgi:hypothetical protein
MRGVINGKNSNRQCEHCEDTIPSRVSESALAAGGWAWKRREGCAPDNPAIIDPRDERFASHVLLTEGFGTQNKASTLK